MNSNKYFSGLIPSSILNETIESGLFRPVGLSDPVSVKASDCQLLKLRDLSSVAVPFGFSDAGEEPMVELLVLGLSVCNMSVFSFVAIVRDSRVILFFLKKEKREKKSWVRY